MSVLYPGIPFSPQAVLTANVGEADTIIKVSDVNAFPPAPNLATIGTDENGETILYTAKTADALSGCQRGVEGAARAWDAGELIGRNFTAKDHTDLITATNDAPKTADAQGVTFADGETFQQKYDSGELAGNDGKPGGPGPMGPPGPAARKIVVSLPSSGWENKAQTAHDADLLASGYTYVITPDSPSYGQYASCMVYADDITADREITFHCDDVPTVNLTVVITRIEVENE